MVQTKEEIEAEYKKSISRKKKIVIYGAIAAFSLFGFRMYQSFTTDTKPTPVVQQYLDASKTLDTLERTKYWFETKPRIEDSDIPYKQGEIKNRLDSIFKERSALKENLEGMISSVKQEVSDMETNKEVVNYAKAVNEKLDKGFQGFLEAMSVLLIVGVPAVFYEIKIIRRKKKKLAELSKLEEDKGNFLTYK